MRRLQVRIGFVQRVAVSKFGEGCRNPDFVLAHMARAPGPFVDVIAEMDDQIQISRCHVTVGGKITLLILLAGRKGKSEPAITPGWRSAGTPHRAHCRTCTESIPINPARTQT